MGEPVLLIKREWADLILSKEKTMEVRGSDCKHIGTRVFLGVSREGGKVAGYCVFGSTIPIKTVEEFRALENEHRVVLGEGEDLPYPTRTFGWRIKSVVKYFIPQSWNQPRGPIVWSKVQ
jgi:hypothetical protein